MADPKVSIIVRFRNEYPTILGTLLSYLEDAEASKIPFELIAVDNLSDDPAADVLEDRFRRWKRAGLLKVVRYSDKASTWCAINAGYQEAQGEVIVVSDAHMSVRRGSLALLTRSAHEQGGIWHPAVHLWGDTDDIQNYGYDLRLKERFWGNPCRYLPPGREIGDAWKVPMAGAYCLAVSRREVSKLGLYHKGFRAYGGGEPYLDLKWWMGGSAVWVHSGAMVRHAFGTKAEWREDKAGAKPHRNAVWTDRGRATKSPEPGEKYLAYGAGWPGPTSIDFAFNFSLAAYVLGGERWLDNTVERLAREGDREAVRGQVVAEGNAEHEWIARGATTTLDALLAEPPWEVCGRHDQEGPL